MKESIIIKNLGPLQDIIIEDIKPLSILIGSSGSGKSLLMKTISMMRYIYKRVNIRSYLINSGLKRSPFRLRFESMLHDDMDFYLKQSNVKIIYKVEFSSGWNYTVEYSDGTIKVPKKIADDDLVFAKESWVSETRNVIPQWIANPANGRGSLGFYFTETLNDFGEGANVLKEIDMAFVGARLEIVKVKGILRFMLKIEGVSNPIELRFASSGMQTSAPLALLVKYFSNDFSFKDAKRRSVLSYLYDTDQLAEFHPSIELAAVKSLVQMHIEEPELSLDPRSQIKLLDTLIDTAFINNTNNVNLMFATHSPYIVNALNLVMARTRGTALAADKIGVYRLVDGRNINVMSQDQDGRHIVDTGDLTEPMAEILDEYRQLMR